MGDSWKARTTPLQTVSTDPEIAAQLEGQSTPAATRPARSTNDDDEVLQADDPEEDGPSVIDDAQLYGMCG